MTPGEKYRDLGGGVYEDGPPAAHPTPAGQPPSCPFCGDHDTTERVSHPEGEWLCGCGTLFTGGDAEWRRWRERRETTARRQRDGYQPLSVQRYEKRPGGKPPQKESSE